jgi:hypothetical protein
LCFLLLCCNSWLNELLVFISCLVLAGGDKDKDNRCTKLKSTSARRATAEENPHIKQARKKGPLSQFDVAVVTSDADAASDTTAASIVVHEAQSQSQPDADSLTTLTEPTETGREPDITDDRDNVAHDIEMEEQLREDGEACVPTWRNVWTKTYEGLPMPDVFPSGPLDTTVLMGYACHVARYIYDSHVS